MSRKALRDLHLTFPWLAGFLGAFGGWGFKWTRRYLLPFLGAVLALGYGIAWWRCLLYAAATVAAFSLGYSPERNAWAVIVLVGGGYGATPWLLGFRRGRWWWPLATGLLFAGMMETSLRVGWFSWKIVEGIIFFAHGCLVSWTIEQERG